MDKFTLTDPDCELGYSTDFLSSIFPLPDGRSLDDLMDWMRGQTMAVCDGQKYNHEEKKYEPTNCGPHGAVIYRWDLERFINRQPIID